MSHQPSSHAGLHQGVIYALAAAALFGASTPFAKSLVGHAAPVAVAGMLYFGSGLGLLALHLLRGVVLGKGNTEVAGLTRTDWPWLGGAILAGGVAGPVLLMLGLSTTPASSASLLLKTVVAGALLSWDQATVHGIPLGALAIVGACLCWGIDNNLTRKVSASDAVQIACVKGLAAGAVNLAIAAALDMRLPAPPVMFSAAAIGFCGYGLSPVLFVLALRHLGTARTGAYFSAAPFVGAAISLVVPGEHPGPFFWVAALLMGAGIWLHLTESHDHEHEHEAMDHTHAHRHDAHHQHEHDFAWDGNEPHVLPHRHKRMRHAHKHYPDIHHQHGH